MPRLLWRDAQGIEGSLDLTSAEIKVGRAMDCAIRTDDAMVSRHHSRIFWGGGGYVLEDLSSANGVYFQEQRVQSHLFKHGDAVRCGSLWLRFVDQAQIGATPAAGPGTPAPMMQHPGMGAIAPAGPTGHVAAINPGGMSASMPAQQPGAAMAALGVAPANQESDAEIRVLRRRVEQLQTELRMYRSQKFKEDNVRRMEDLENDLSMMEIERDNLKTRLDKAEQSLKLEAGSIKVKRALEIAAMTAETAASLNDLLSSLRIEVMAAEGEFDQYAHSIPRASFELIRQSLKDAASHCDDARELLRKLREVAE
ncbi:MAG TPA: FHA domain-containing protein [Kofleriaceae bacterium]|nr:FHA domain-containing protein [Kofleriaceae bacterium]